ncbi:hypothetical protein BY458DRAFT_505746 [Sporodiniella umbellata]|nr:hypothetical protein BY458DRAFT_505746 [Sporodiniella umbellata]
MSIQPSKQAVLHAYRSLLKTQKKVFLTDLKAIEAGRKETHFRFMQHKDETNTEILEEKLNLAYQVENLLKKNVLQGVGQEDNTFKLRITKDLELGDNDSIKNTKSINRKKKHTKQCCGGH